jgi:hypothetical protein
VKRCGWMTYVPSSRFLRISQPQLSGETRRTHISQFSKRLLRTGMMSRSAFLMPLRMRMRRCFTVFTAGLSTQTRLPPERVSRPCEWRLHAGMWKVSWVRPVIESGACESGALWGRCGG